MNEEPKDLSHLAPYCGRWSAEIVRPDGKVEMIHGVGDSPTLRSVFAKAEKIHVLPPQKLSTEGRYVYPPEDE